MNADEIVKALETEVLCESCPHNESDCPDDGCYYIMAAALIDKLQALAENGQSAIDTNTRLVKVVESLQAQLAKEKRRAEKAIADLKYIAVKYIAVCETCKKSGVTEYPESAVIQCEYYDSECGCGKYEWRGDAEEGDAE